MTTATIDLETALLDAHYQGDPVARFAWLGWCEDNGVRLTEVGVTGVWRGTLAEWLEVGPQVVRRVALERVELSDREPRPPYDRCDKWGWFVRTRVRTCDDFPLGFFPEIKSARWVEYPTRQDALDDATRRAVRWAREQGQRQEVMG